jgi:peptidoglycan/LPS O-acetylase OafA/YrhL
MNADLQRRRAKSLGRFARWGLVGITVAWGIGQFFRDGNWVTALLFYIPSPLLAFVLLGAVAVHFRRRRWRWATGLGALAILPFCFVIGVENKFFVALPPKACAGLN